MGPPPVAHLPLKRAQTAEDFSAAPAGSYFASRSFLYFHTQQHLSGFALWGCPDVDEVRLLIGVMSSTSVAPAAAHASLVDLSGLVCVDADSFAAFSAGLARNLAGLKSAIIKQAILRPDGLTGAVVAGFYDLLTPPYPAKVFTDTEHACDWLDVPESSLALSSLRHLVQDESGVRPLVNRLQRLLDGNRGERMPIGGAASHLGVSERTLQRRLKMANTTFQKERETSQVRLAKQLMLDGRSSLTAIAFEVGCLTSGHFSALFRRVTGMTPTAWRSQASERSSEPYLVREDSG